jgi:hypothetical protein
MQMVAQEGKLALINSLNPKWINLYNEGKIDWELLKKQNA